MKRIIFILTAWVIAYSCNNNQDASDAFGNFEGNPVMVAAESQGRILNLDVEEGQVLMLNQKVGAIDSMQLHLQKKQLHASLQTIRSRSVSLDAQIATQRVQLTNLEREANRIKNLLEDGASTPKQKDDMEGNIALLNAQIRGLVTQKQTIEAEVKALFIQMDQLQDQINRTVIQNPVEGVVLQKYKQQGELVVPGQAIYKIANMEKLILRAYISGRQLSQVNTGQQVTVRIDGVKTIEEMVGTITWVASQAEFTPKIIQTREERVNLVYAIKVEVVNDGRLKIGMPGEVKL
ncbi:MAG: HlyD family efflux transporter periplasmic adaptor subunit [Bacteroidales bacterium]